MAEKVQRFAAGPESFPLPYLSLLTLVFGVILAFLPGDSGARVAIFVVAVLGAFVFARAAIAIQPVDGCSSAQSWLLTPALLMMYVSLWTALAAWPVVSGGIVVERSYIAPQVKLQEMERIKTSMIQHKDLHMSGLILSGSIAQEYHGRITLMGHPPDQEYDQIGSFLDAKIRDLQAQQKSLLSVLIVPILVVAGWWLLLGAFELAKPQVFRVVFAPYSLRTTHLVLCSVGGLTLLSSILILSRMSLLQATGRWARRGCSHTGVATFARRWANLATAGNYTLNRK